MTELAPAVPGVESLELIGRGGFASVYSGWQQAFHRRVAVKVLHTTADDVRFTREVMAMGSLSHHPHVVPVYDAGTVDDVPYLIMPLLPGRSLDDELRRGPFPSEQAVEIGIAVADALAAAHAEGVLHRDVKPGNIMQDANGSPLLGDFGIARFVDHTATMGDPAVTVAYAAPEVLRGEPATVASDVYSLGATLYALLQGAPPVVAREGEMPVSMALRAVQQEPPPLVGVPPWLAAVVQKAMAKEPGHRYPTAAALREALAAGEVPVAAPVPSRPRTRRSPAGVLVGLASAVALVALVLVALALRSGGGGHLAATATSTTTQAATSSSVVGAAAAATPTTGKPSPDVDATVRRYYALLDAGRDDDAFAMLTPRYQQASGVDAYRGFWSTIAHVAVVSSSPADGRCGVTLRYTRTDGSSTTESNTLRLVRDGSGWKIDGYA